MPSCLYVGCINGCPSSDPDELQAACGGGRVEVAVEEAAAEEVVVVAVAVALTEVPPLRLLQLARHSTKIGSLWCHHSNPKPLIIPL